MRGFIFLLLHIACVLFFIPGLIVTIPLHIIVNVMSKQPKVVYVNSKPSAPKFYDNEDDHKDGLLRVVVAVILPFVVLVSLAQIWVG